MAFTLDGVSESDLRRFAACWLKSELNTNWDEAAALFDPEGKIKVQSFRTVTGRAITKVTGEKPAKAGAGAGGAGGGGGGKRKKTPAVMEEEDGEGLPKAKKGKATNAAAGRGAKRKKGKRGMAAEGGEEDDHVEEGVIKDEEVAGNDYDEYGLV